MSKKITRINPNSPRFTTLMKHSREWTRWPRRMVHTAPARFLRHRVRNLQRRSLKAPDTGNQKLNALEEVRKGGENVP